MEAVEEGEQEERKERGNGGRKRTGSKSRKRNVKSFRKSHSRCLVLYVGMASGYLPELVRVHVCGGEEVVAHRSRARSRYPS